MKLIPELRFPEVDNKFEWEEKALIKLADRVLLKNKDSKVNRVFTNSAVQGIVDQREYFEKDIANKGNLENYYVVEDGDYIYNPRISKEAPVGPTSKNKTGHTGVMSPLYTVFRFKNRNNEFYEYYFNSFHWYDSIRRASNTGARFDRMSITDSVFMNIPVLYPQPAEQQKIASCLSSLDEVIAAHNDKLDALKDHKKGLLQNLFPQEGETVPKVRFPEFEGDGDWVKKKLGQIGDPLMCKRIFKNQTTPNPENGIPFYKIGTFGKEPDSYISPELYEEFKLKYNFPNKGDILISASGTIGRLVVYDGAPAYFQDSNIVWLGHSEKEVSNDFLYYCYSIVNWQTSDGGVIKRIYNSDLKAISIKFPENETEQQKIASCLAAMDELITAQQGKIDELKQHKKGLMQGLFPKIES